MNKRFTGVLAAALALLLVLGSSVYAFNDTKGDPHEAQINALREAGIISGIDDERFDPKGTVTLAQAVVMLVKAFDLNLDDRQYVKQPKASDHFPNMADDAWYAQAFLYAAENGLPIQKDADPNGNLTKEQYAHLLHHALTAKADYAVIEMYVMIKDEQNINPDYMTSIQRLILMKITELSDGSFYPQRDITRAEAAHMLHNAVEFAKKHPPVLPLEPSIVPDIELEVTEVNEDVNKVTLVWAEGPHPGYGLRVTAIEFTDNNEAVITYAVQEPDPDRMYPQVITEIRADTYISSAYKPVLNSPR